MIRKVKAGTAIGYTQPNFLTEDPNSYTLMLRGNTSRSLDDIISIFLRQSNLNLTHEQARESFINVLATAHDEVLRGNTVSLEYLSIRTAVSGVFNDPTETYDPKKHNLKVVYTPGEEVRSAIKRTAVRNMGRAVNNEIGNITNRVTGNVNMDVTPGGPIEIVGSNIKVGSGELDSGKIFFLDEESNTIAANVLEKDLLLNIPSKLLFVAPANLVPGKQYRIKISTYKARGNQKTLRNQRLLESDVVLTCI